MPEGLRNFVSAPVQRKGKKSLTLAELSECRSNPSKHNVEERFRDRGGVFSALEIMTSSSGKGHIQHFVDATEKFQKQGDLARQVNRGLCRSFCSWTGNMRGQISKAELPTLAKIMA